MKCVVDSVDSRGEERERCVTGIQALVPYQVTVSEKMALHARWRLVELLQVLGQRNTLNQPLLINQCHIGNATPLAVHCWSLPDQQCWCFSVYFRHPPQAGDLEGVLRSAGRLGRNSG